MKKKILVGVALLLGALGVSAQTTVPVQNPDFTEINPLSQGTYNYGPIPSWNITGPLGTAGSETCSNCPASSAYAVYNNGGLASGATYQPGISGGFIYQAVPASFQPNTTYTLTVYVGNAAQYGSANGATFTISLSAGSTTVASTTAATKTITGGTWAVQTVTYTSGISPPSGNITINLESAGPNGGYQSQSAFSNVLLTMSSPSCPVVGP